MKKLKLKAIDMGAQQFLSRHQLKNVLGGWEEQATTTTEYCGTCGPGGVYSCVTDYVKGRCECPGAYPCL